MLKEGNDEMRKGKKEKRKENREQKNKIADRGRSVEEKTDLRIKVTLASEAPNMKKFKKYKLIQLKEMCG